MFIRNAWYVGALDKEVGEDLFARDILGEQVLMYRRGDGSVVAMEDRCAHRQVPLSKGRRRGDEVECWYHGMRYAASGECVHIPTQSMIPQRACVRTFPAVEKDGFVWLWMGDPSRRDESLIPSHSVCSAPNMAGEMIYCPIACNYLFGIDNLLDVSHVTFVHLKTLVSDAVAETPPDIVVNDKEIIVRRTLRNEKAPPLHAKIMNLEFIDRVQEVRYWPVGNTRVETIAYPPGRPEGPALRLYTTTIFTPATEKTMHTFVGMHRDFAIDNAQLTKMITGEVDLTVNEDRDVAEHLQNNWKNEHPLVQLTVDRASNAARQMLDRLLREDGAVEQRPVAEPA